MDSSFDPNFEPLNTLDFESQQLLGALSAADEADNGSSDGAKRKQGSKRRLIEVVDDEDDSDVEITPPPTQTTIDGGIGSSSQASKAKKIHVMFTIRGGRKSSKPTQGNGKKNVVHAAENQPQKKKQVEAEQLDLEGECDEDEKHQKENRHWSDVWDDFSKIQKTNGEERAKCNHCKNEYAWSSHSHGTIGLRRHCDRCKLYPRNLGNKKLNAEAKLHPGKYDHVVFRQLVSKSIIQHDLPYSYVEYEKVRDTWKYLNADVKFICRNTAKADVYRFYENERERH
ncbi:hypothetical protein N665_0223s0016 [Sinapis alba]|nr:hypothetical protein N665_0223s0016 [Sinapis alba]